MNISLENTTLNDGNFTTLTPTISPIVGATIAISTALAGLCFFMMIPFIVECLVDKRRNCRNSCYCLFCCSKDNQLSDIERNNLRNMQLIAENKKKNDMQIKIVDLTEVVIANPFDATETCSICLEELDEGDELGSLPCGHKHFHKKCVDQWLQISGNKSCPLCRNILS